jgi:hypothetical protein
MRAHDQDRFERIYEPVLRMLATVREPVEVAKIEEWDAGPAAPDPGRDPRLAAVPQRNA